MATFICSCLAKTSVMWIPLLYINTSTQFRFSLVNTNALENFVGPTTAVQDEVSNTIAVIGQTKINRGAHQ